MRWLALLLVLLLAGSGADARLLSGGGSSNACGPYVNGITLGDSLCPPTSNFANSLEDSSTNFYQFTNSQGLPPNYDLTIGGHGVKAVLQSVVAPYSSPRVYLEISNPLGDLLWFCQCSFQNQTPAASPTALATGNFINVTQGKSFNNFGELINTTGPGTFPPNAGDTLHVTAPPAGIPYWDLYPPSANIGVIATPVTINFDAGAHFKDSEGLGGQGVIIVNAANVTLNGGEVSNSGDTAWRVDDNATNPTLKNGKLHDEGSTCLLSGAHEGTITLSGMLVYNCNTNVQNFGQSHGIYISRTNQIVTDATCEAIDTTTSLNVLNDGWSFKIRPICSAGQQGLITTSLAGCTPSAACRQNGAFDYPCGGNHKMTHSVMELEGIVVADGGGWYVGAYGEETSNQSPAPANCPSITGATNTLAFDLDTFLIDANPGANFSDVCLLKTDGGTSGGTTCLPSALSGFTCALTNSIIVSNGTLAFNKGGCSDSGAGCTLSAGKCTDANNNRWYQTRTLAASNEGWSGTWTDPTTGTVYNCCAWPWKPPHL